MADKFLAYTKRNDFLVCVDSDGCAMDTMDIKHFRCFGPCMVTEWGLEEWRGAILNRWNEINLYTMTRGINRFRGLAKALAEIQENTAGLRIWKGWCAGWMRRLNYPVTHWNERFLRGKVSALRKPSPGAVQ